MPQTVDKRFLGFTLRIYDSVDLGWGSQFYIPNTSDADVASLGTML